MENRRLTFRKTSVRTDNTTPGSEPVQSLEPGEIITGTHVNIMPKILEVNEKMMLTMMMDISSLNFFRFTRLRVG
ncbi:hypothetical protein [Candidatus Hamiltonella defensa]|uniref:hypothetical protein n=1 Tax=Candidatus Williamhamiltonella defendens TaxID=138072 RepID=UPI00158251E3|nr:hypothetical protein [Candidatus Hamiltonella defensa]